VKTTKINPEDAWVDQAVTILKQGGVIAYPTEAVYGLGCDPADINAIKRILTLKHREKEKGLILVAANFEQLKPYLQPVTQEIEKKLLASWPGPVTWLMPAKETTSDYIKGQFTTLAVRVSNHPVVKSLCEKFGSAIISTSANIATQEAARTAKQVKEIFSDKLDMIVDGETDKNAKPSEIRDALTDKIIRSGQ